MAETTEKIILEINVDSYLNELTAVNEQINVLKKNQKELKEQAEKGDEEAAKNLQITTVALKVQNAEYINLQKTLVGFTIAQKNEADTVNFANNSIKTNRALLQQLTEQYNTLKKPPAELTATIKKLSDTLKEQEGAIGDTRRNVGNYTESILDAVGGLKLFGKDLGQVIDPLKKFGGSLGAVSSGAQGLTAALLATGLPLLIAGINAVADALQNYQSIANQTQDITGGVKQAFKELIPTLLSSEGASKVAQVGILGIVGAMKDAYDAGVAFSKIQREINIAQRENSVQNSKDAIDIENLLLGSRDRNKTESERIGLLKDAIALQKESSEKEQQIVDRQIALNEEEIKRTKKRFGEATKDELDTRADLLVKKNKFAEDAVTFEEKQQRRLNQLIKEDIARDVALFDNRSKLLIDSGQATADKLILIEKQKTARILEDAALQEDERFIIIKQSQIKVIQLQQEFDNRTANARIKALELQAAEDAKVGKDITKQLVEIEDEKTKVLLNNILLNNEEKANARREGIDNDLKIQIDGNNKIIDEIIRGQELLAKEQAANGIDNTALLVQIEQNRSDRVLSTLQQGSKAYENEIKRRNLAVDDLLNKDANRIIQAQIKLSDLELQTRKENYDEQVKTGKLFGDAQIEQLKSINQQEIDLEREKNAAIQIDDTKSKEDKAIAQKESDLKILKLQHTSAQQQLEVSKRLELAQISAIDTVANATFSAINDIGTALGANAEFQKALALFQILTQEAIAIATAIANATLAGSTTGGFGTPVFIATFVSAVLGAFAGVVKFITPVPKPPKLAEGGGIDIDGRSHAEGGTPIHVNGRLVAEAQKGEKMFILKKEASEKINSLSVLNQMFGGRSFNDSPVTFAAGGGEVSVKELTNVQTNDGGFFARSIQKQLDIRALELALTKVMKSAPAPVVSVKEITRVTDNLNRSTRVSEAG